jgi:hypothetical protein
VRKLLLLLSIVISLSLKTQTCTTTVAYDNIEDYNWIGLWFGNTFNSSYYIDASVSPATSAVIYGSGTGTSSTEQDWYVMPNITGLDPSYTYQFKMRLGSYTFTNSTATSRGVDGSDFVEVQVSTNGEISYTSEIRITGNNNATWNYNTLGVINKTANGTLTTYAPAAGGNRTTTSDGYSDITLTLTGISQLAVDILCRVNANGEEWWLDNIQLVEIAPCSPLPVALSSFKVVKKSNYNEVSWRTETEQNNDYFVLERSSDALTWSEVAKIKGNGDSYSPINYLWKDKEYNKSSNYYKLKQFDFNGEISEFDIIYVDNWVDASKIIKTIDISGRVVDRNQPGIVIDIYSDGTYNKRVNIE